MRALWSARHGESRRLLLALLVPNVVALPAVGWLADRPAPWNWVALTVLAAYLVVVTVILQREWSAGRRRRKGPGRHAA